MTVPCVKTVTNRDNKVVTQQDVKSVISNPVNNQFNTSGALAVPKIAEVTTFDSVTQQHNKSSSFIGSETSSNTTQTFNFGDIHITATDGKIDAEAFKEQVIQAMKEINQDKKDFSFKKTA